MLDFRIQMIEVMMNVLLW